MIFPRNQNWRTSQLPFSLSLANTVNTGVSFDTSSGAIANQKYWASKGLRGFGPRMSYFGAGMDGCGCGCGDGGSNWMMIAAAAALAWCFLRNRGNGGLA